MKIYRYTPFESNPFGNGGEKRTHQIGELLNDMNLDYQFLKPCHTGSKFSRFISTFFNVWIIKSYILPVKSLHQYGIILSNIYFAKKLLSKIESKSLIIYEHSLNLNWYIPLLFKKKGHKILAIPHNFETLVPTQFSGLSMKANPQGLFEEIEVLNASDLVLTISKEEEWLLNLFRINALYFPYYPSSIELNKFREIAQIRKDRKQNKNFLILGTASNPPTKMGMLELLSNLNQSETIDFTFHIAGYFTESLSRENQFPDRFIFHGSIAQEKLYHLFQTTDAAIIHQGPSTGALTKIPELLSAGIPVIANQHAARNYFSINGVSIYREFKELIQMLQNTIDTKQSIDFEKDVNLNFIKQQIKKLVD